MRPPSKDERSVRADVLAHLLVILLLDARATSTTRLSKDNSLTLAPLGEDPARPEKEIARRSSRCKTAYLADGSSDWGRR
jgi:hypothetical protein